MQGRRARHHHWNSNSNVIDETLPAHGLHICHLISLSSSHEGPCRHAYFTEEPLKAQRGEMTCLSHHTVTSIAYYWIFVCLFFLLI